MGNILFDINGNVNLNKQVEWQINKNVVGNVEIEDKLATAQADAEAFGEFAFAETDAFALVNDEFASSYSEATAGLEIEPSGDIFDGGTDIVGNIPVFEPTGDLGESDTTINVDLDGNPGAVLENGDVVPNVDDIDGSGALIDLSSPPPNTPDAPIPDPALSMTDLDLEFHDTTGNPNIFEYNSTADFITDFGVRDLDFDQDGNIDFTGNVSLTIPQDTVFLVTDLGSDAYEIEFEEFGDDVAFYTLDGIGIGDDNFEVEALEFTATTGGVAELGGNYTIAADAVFGVLPTT